MLSPDVPENIVDLFVFGMMAQPCFRRMSQSAITELFAVSFVRVVVFQICRSVNIFYGFRDCFDPSGNCFVPIGHVLFCPKEIRLIIFRPAEYFHIHQTILPYCFIRHLDMFGVFDFLLCLLMPWITIFCIRRSIFSFLFCVHGCFAAQQVFLFIYEMTGGGNVDGIG